MDEEQLAEWTTAYMNDLPDSCFLYIEEGGKKDSEGKTVPRSLRKLPYKDANGKVDMPHLRNALSRLGQEGTDIPESTKMMLMTKAKKMLGMMNKEEHSMEDKMSEKEEKLEDTQVTSGTLKEDVTIPAKVEDNLTKEEIKDAEEQLAASKEMKKTQEELAVIKEVREELIATYADNQKLEAQVEQLKKENESLKAEHVKISEQLNGYVEAEKKFESKKREERLSKLCSKFERLGQVKTMEELSIMDDKTISTFEGIVDAALVKVGDVKEAPSKTIVTETVKEPVKSEDTKKSITQNVQPKVDKGRTFFAQICNTLTKEQGDLVKRRGLSL